MRETPPFFEFVIFLCFLIISDNIERCYLVSEIPRRGGMQLHAKKLSNSVVSSHIDQIGDQSEVHVYVYIYICVHVCVYMYICTHIYIHMYLIVLIPYGDPLSWSEHPFATLYSPRGLTVRISYVCVLSSWLLCWALPYMRVASACRFWYICCVSSHKTKYLVPLNVYVYI